VLRCASGRENWSPLVGANGAGKTTLLKTISGLIAPRAGTAELAGKPLFALSSVARVRLGLAHVPEGRQIFGDLSVAENLEIGAYTQLGGISNDEYAARAAEVYRIFPILKGKRTTGGRRPVGRPAADAGDRARPHAQTATTVAR